MQWAFAFSQLIWWMVFSCLLAFCCCFFARYQFSSYSSLFNTPQFNVCADGVTRECLSFVMRAHTHKFDCNLNIRTWSFQATSSSIFYSFFLFFTSDSLIQHVFCCCSRWKYLQHPPFRLPIFSSSLVLSTTSYFYAMMLLYAHIFSSLPARSLSTWMWNSCNTHSFSMRIFFLANRFVCACIFVFSNLPRFVSQEEIFFVSYQRMYDIDSILSHMKMMMWINARLKEKKCILCLK